MGDPLPILIVGAGPVGLSLATALAKQGLTIALFEALPELSTEIRASTFHPATLELFAEWGVVDALLDNGQRVDQLMYWERSTRQRIAAFDYHLLAQDTPFPFRLQCPQHIATRVLKPLLEQSEFATVFMGHRYLDHVDHGTHVEARFETADSTIITVKGAYLCGSDGSRSAVRKQLQLPFEGMTYEDRFLLVGADLNLTPYFPNIGPVNYMFDPEEWVVILHLPDLVRIVFRMQAHEQEEEALQETAVRQRVARFLGQDVPFNILMTSVYKVHQRVADRFRVGRTLLLGDAAHINSPAGGMGMNSGIHDAHNLADKLTRVMAGGSEALLDQYNAERHAVAQNLIKIQSDRNYKDWTAKDDTYRLRRNTELREAAADPKKARAYLLKMSMMTDRI